MSITLRAEVLGTSSKLVWFRVWWDSRNVILTQPRKHLPRGMAECQNVNIEFNGVVHSGSEEEPAPYSGYYVDDPKVTRVEQERDTPGT